MEITDAGKRLTKGIETMLQSMLKTTNVIICNFENIQKLSGNVMDASVQTAKAMFDMSDRISNATVRLGLMADAEPGQSAGQAVREMQDKIFSAANRSRTDYPAMETGIMNMSLSAPEVFSTNDEAIQFMESLNKQFAIAGADAEAVQSATAHMTQALGAGAMYGEELYAVYRATPDTIQTIADYMGVSMEEIREMAWAGKITAEIIKNAMLSATDSINSRFKEMPVTFEQAGNIFRNHVMQSLKPVWGRLQEIAGSREFMNFAVHAANGMGMVAEAIVLVLDLGVRTGSLIADNWQAIEPVLAGVCGAISTYIAYQIISNILTATSTAGTLAYNVVLMATAIAMGIVAFATGNAALAQTALNTAMMVCPVMWIVLLIGILVMALYKLVQSVGGLKAAWLICMNEILTKLEYAKIGISSIIYNILNKFDLMKLGLITISAAISNILGDMKVNVLTTLQLMINGAIDLINRFIDRLNRIPGVSIDAIGHITFAAEAAAENEAMKHERMDNLRNKADEVRQNMADREADLEAMRAEAGMNQGIRLIGIATERVKALVEKNPIEKEAGLNTAAEDINSIAAHTGNISNTLEITDEDIKYLRDIAERDAINRFTTAEIRVDMGGVNNHINSSMDLDGFMQSFCSGLEEASAIAAEGAHYGI